LSQYDFEERMQYIRNLSNGGRVVIVSSRAYISCDAQSTNWMEQRRSQLYQENFGRDLNCFVTRTIKVPGLSVVTCAPSPKPWWLNSGVYLLACLFGLFGPWRWLFNGVIHKVGLSYTKMVSVVSASDAPPNSSGMRIEMIY